MMLNWIARYRELVRIGRYYLSWSGSWDWFPTRGGFSVGATLVYRQLYGERWWRVIGFLDLGPFRVLCRYNGFEESADACHAAAVEQTRQDLQRSLDDIKHGRVHDHEDVRRELG